MGEEEKKQTEKKKENEVPTKKPEEQKKINVVAISENKEAKKAVDESKEKKEESGSLPSPPPPPPPQEIILKVYMHCEGCARKVRRCLKGFEGVEDVVTDTKAHTVVVKGEKADPLKVLQRVQDKNHRRVELLSPIPKPLPDEPKIAPPKEIVNPEPEKKEVITVMLKVNMHCEACAQEIRRRIQKMQGVESATADLKTSEVVVKGSFEPPKLIDFIRKRTGKHALIVKVEPEKKVEEKAKESSEEKKDTKKGGGDDDEGGKDSKKDEGGKDSKKDEGTEGENKAAKEDGEQQEDPKLELKKSELLYNYPQYYQQLNHQSFIQHELNAYPPQMFSDENPNSCSVM